MSYPDESTHPITEWYIDGAWVDLSDRVRADDGIEIDRGRQNEQGTISPTSATCMMDNRDFALSNRNPESIYYRKISTGTPVRHRAGDGDNCIYMRYNTFSNTAADDDFTSVRTPDAAALDITGDIEIRCDIRPHTWRPASLFMVLASKYLSTGNNISWALVLTEGGFPSLMWTTGGSVGTFSQITASAAIPATSGRLSIKATLDVDNGAGGNVVRFYTAPSIDGTYTQLGGGLLSGSTTSIFSGTAALILGGGEAATDLFAGGMGFGGTFHNFRLYNGIGGSLVADPNFSLWSLDDTSKADPSGKTWTVNGQARITSPRVRFVGELTSATQSEDKSARDKYIPIQAADILQRLGDGKVAEFSPIYLNTASRAGLLGYWPMEDGTDSTSVATTVAGSRAGVPTGVAFGQSNGLPGAKRTAQLSAQASNVTMKPKAGSGNGTIYAIWMFKMGDTLPGPALTQFVQLNTTGTARYISFLMNTTQFDLQFRESDFVTLLDSSPGGFGTGVVVTEEWIAMRVKLTQNGANVDWEWAWYQQGSSTSWGSSGSYAGTVGYVNTVGVSAAGSSLYAGAGIAHFIVAEQDLNFGTSGSEWEAVIEAYAGETAAARIKRVAEAENIYCEIIGKVDSSALLGSQPVDTPLNVFLDTQRADGGVFTGLRDKYGVQYRTRQDLERHTDIELPYGSLSDPPKVIDDAQTVTNAFTATRTGGSSAFAEITDGPNSTQEPPDGQGYRPGGDTFNIYADERLPSLANLRARYASFDSPRIPNLEVGMHRATTHPSTSKGASLAALDVGSTVSVSGWPAQDAPDDQLFLVQGYRERLQRYLWSLRFNTTPAGPYRTGLWTVDDQAAGPTRYGSDDSTLNAGATSTATTIVIARTRGVWTSVSARYPLDIMVSGEQITLTQAPGGSTSPQTFDNVTRSVNGVVKALSAGDEVHLHVPTYYGLGT